ncbi:hypothetical protein M0804_013723 [Polistes exclamans]|nr:hypothetical protein M0804_013723 [Polistes exclamans]
MAENKICTICDEALDYATSQVATIRRKGLQSLIAKSKLLNDGKWEFWNIDTPLLVHNTCRMWYTTASIKSVAKRAAKLKSLSTSSTETPSTSAKLSKSEPMETEFNFRDLCLICAQSWIKRRKPGSVIQNDYMKERFLNMAEKRNDEWGIDVQNRLKHVDSVVALGARYHKKCYKTFSKIAIDTSDRPSRSKEIEADFQIIANYIKDSPKGRFTANELLYLNGSRCFTRKVLYRKLMEFFGEDIYILSQQGRETTILYKSFSSTKLCEDWYRDPDSLDIKQQEAIVSAAAQIVRKNIENHEYKKNSYQPAGKFLHSVQQDIPPLLRVLIDQLTISNSFKKDDNDEEQKYIVQRSAIAHSIIALIRRSDFTSHLQLALGIYIHRKCGSKLIIDILNKIGFCVSYYQLQQYEASIIMDPPKFVLEDDVCVQHVFDNIDHNVGALDSNNTHQCLGAPDELLKMVQCTCSEANKTLRCSCQKTGLVCPQLCEYCGGQSCSNFSINTVVDSREIQAEERDQDDENISRNEFLDIIEELDPPEDFHYEECD